jgi:hypothetical protein
MAETPVRSAALPFRPRPSNRPCPLGPPCPLDEPCSLGEPSPRISGGLRDGVPGPVDNVRCLVNKLRGLPDNLLRPADNPRPSRGELPVTVASLPVAPPL